jgi:hypothetical protein
LTTPVIRLREALDKYEVIVLAMPGHPPTAPRSQHAFIYDPDYLLTICGGCGRRKSTGGTKVKESTREVLKHDQRASGCRACNRQFCHTMPEDLEVALDQAAWEVGRHHGRAGSPEWTQASKAWFGVNFHMAAYEAGYRTGAAEQQAA